MGATRLLPPTDQSGNIRTFPAGGQSNPCNGLVSGQYLALTSGDAKLGNIPYYNGASNTARLGTVAPPSQGFYLGASKFFPYALISRFLPADHLDESRKYRGLPCESP
jgi:hypothetical protein